MQVIQQSTQAAKRQAVKEALQRPMHFEHPRMVQTAVERSRMSCLLEVFPQSARVLKLLFTMPAGRVGVPKPGEMAMNSMSLAVGHALFTSWAYCMTATLEVRRCLAGVTMAV